MIQFINSIYRKTQFDNQGGSMIGVGFEIGEVRFGNGKKKQTDKNIILCCSVVISMSCGFGRQNVELL